MLQATSSKEEYFYKNPNGGGILNVRYYLPFVVRSKFRRVYCEFFFNSLLWKDETRLDIKKSPPTFLWTDIRRSEFFCLCWFRFARHWVVAGATSE